MLNFDSSRYSLSESQGFLRLFSKERPARFTSGRRERVWPNLLDEITCSTGELTENDISSFKIIRALFDELRDATELGHIAGFKCLRDFFFILDSHDEQASEDTLLRAKNNLRNRNPRFLTGCQFTLYLREEHLEHEDIAFLLSCENRA